MMPRTPGPGESRPGRPGDPAARVRNQAGGTLQDLTPLGKVIFMFGKRGLIVGAAAFALTASVAASWRAARHIVRHHDASPGGRAGPEAGATTMPQMPAGQSDVPPRDAAPFPAEPGAGTTALRELPGWREPASAPAAGLFPVIHQRSRLATAPWRLPASASPPGLAADQGTIGSLDVRAASLVGPAHRHTVPALPRQDAYRLGQDTCRGHLIVAVAVLPDAGGEPLLVDLIGDGELQRLFNAHTVNEVEVRSVFRAEQPLNVVLIHLFGEAAVEEQRFPLFVWDQTLDFIAKTLREEEPVKGFATDEIAVGAVADAFLRYRPVANRPH